MFLPNSPSPVDIVQQEMTFHDKYRLEHIFKLLGSRIIPAYFFNQNAMEFCKWQMNACRQTALITAYFFNELLQSFEHTPVLVTLWDGEFHDKVTPWYNHAWMTAMPENPSTRNQVFMDLARISTYPLINWSTNKEKPEDIHPGLAACGTVTDKMIIMSYEDMLKEEEYYTGKTGLQVCLDIKKMMLMYGYDLTKFQWDKPQPPF